MTRTPAFLAVVPLVAAAMLAGALPAAANASAPQPAASPWTEVPAESPSGQNTFLNSVTTPAAGDVWAIGYHWESVGGALEFRALAEHWNGTRFEVVSTPDRETAPAVDFLWDASSSSSTDVWAVGSSLPAAQPERTLVEHWNGAAWSIETSVDPGVHGDELDGVAAIAADDVWTVGSRQDEFTLAPLAEHWNGRSWKVYPVPNPAYCTGHSYLTDVAGTGSRHVWAVGWCGAANRHGEQGYVVRWDGSAWVSGAPNSAIPQNSELYGVTATTGGRVAVVGFTNNDGALIVKYDGTSWTRLRVGAGHVDTTFAAVAARHNGPVWAVGAGTSPQPPFAGPASVRFSGGLATRATVPVDFGSLSGVTVDPGGTVWAVGTQLPGAFNTPLIVSRPY